MRSVGFRRGLEYFLLSALLALSLTGLWLAGAPGGAATSDSSFIFCTNHDGAKIFAGREEPNGNLLFGISVWSVSGQNISVFGIAVLRGSGWRYTENSSAGTAAERCQLEIVRGSDGGLSISADPNATCKIHGGVNAEIGTVEFPRSAYEGAVTSELDNPEAFQKAGKCVGSKY